MRFCCRRSDSRSFVRDGVGKTEVDGSIGFGPLQKLYLSHEHTNPKATDGSIDIIRD